MKNIGHKLAMPQNTNHSNSNGKINEFDNNKIFIPDQMCSIYSSFLYDNFDFFHEYIYGNSEDKKCQELFIHLNNCYSCFCVFSQTMRDYFHKKNEITEHANGVAK